MGCSLTNGILRFHWVYSGGDAYRALRGIAMACRGVAPERTMITVQSFIALVGLTGLVVNDAIVLIDFINRRRREGLPLPTALRIAGLRRLRPNR